MTTIYREYILPLPFTPEQYRIAQLYTVIKVSQQEATGDTSIQIKKNEDVDDEIHGKSRYTEKIFYLNSKVPGVIRAVVPRKALIVEEFAFNSFPTCHTYYTNRAFSEKSFKSSVFSNHISIEKYADLNLPEVITDKNKNSERPNIFSNLSVSDGDYAKSQFKVMDVYQNIQNSMFDPNQIEIDGQKYKPDWYKTANFEYMACQKFVTLKFDVFGLGWLVHEIEKHIDKIFLAAHQQMICTYDEWKDLKMDDIRKMEDSASQKLNEKKGREIE